MKVILKAVNYDKVEEMKKDLGAKCFRSDRAAYHDCDELRDVTLSEYVQMHTYDDCIYFDMAGNKFRLDDNEFESIIVR